MTAPRDSIRLSVVIPVRNGADTIGDQLAALAAQEWSEPWEVIVADNGSTDETRACVEAFAPRLAIRVVDAGGQPGVAFARNTGVDQAAGDLLLFCDADDRVAPGWVAALGDALAEHHAVAGRLDSDSLNPSWLAAVRGRPQQNGLTRFGDRLPYAAAGNFGIRRALHEAIGGFDQTARIIAEDTDYSWRIQKAGRTIAFEPRAVVAYRLRPGFSAVFRQARLYGESYVGLYVKHRDDFPRQRFPLVAGAASWLGLLRHAPIPPTRPRLASFAWQLGWRAGMLQGSIRQRVALLSVRGLPFPEDRAHPGDVSAVDEERASARTGA